MSSTQISSIATDVLQSYRKTSASLIEGYRAGSSRLLDRVHSNWEQGVNTRGSRLSPALREDLIAAGKEINGYYAKGVEKFSDRMALATEAAYDFADAQVKKLSERASRIENAFGQTPLRSLAVVGMPSARVAHEVAEAIATQAQRVAGKVAGADEGAPSAIKSA